MKWDVENEQIITNETNKEQLIDNKRERESLKASI